MLLECLINDLSPQRMQKISLIGYHNQQNYEINLQLNLNSNSQHQFLLLSNSRVSSCVVSFIY